MQKAANGNVGFKNLHITSGNPTNLFAVSSGGSYDILKFIVEDCFIEVNGNMFGYQSANQTEGVQFSYVVEEIEFNNNIVWIKNVSANRKMFTLQKDVALGTENVVAGYSNMKSLSINNNVFYTAENIPVEKRMLIIDFGSNSEGWLTPTNNLEISFKNNTSYNIFAAGQIAIRAYMAKDALIEGNLFYQDITQPVATSNMYIFGLYSHRVENITQTEEESAYKVQNNFAVSHGENATINGWSWLYKNGQPVFYSNTSNRSLLKTDSVPFVTENIDITNGYFPVNASIVTNGAGADYSTKLWKDWSALQNQGQN